LSLSSGAYSVSLCYARIKVSGFLQPGNFLLSEKIFVCRTEVNIAPHGLKHVCAELKYLLWFCFGPVSGYTAFLTSSIFIVGGDKRHQLGACQFLQRISKNYNFLTRSFVVCRRKFRFLDSEPVKITTWLWD
jgi:hypothetical protein